MTHAATISASQTRPRLRASRGFSLMEVMVTLPLVVLLFGGTLTLFIASQRIVQRTSVAVQGSQDAATGLQFVVGTTREAIQFALPPDTSTANTNGMGFLAFDGHPADYQTGGPNNMNTAVELLMPGAASFKLLPNGQPAPPNQPATPNQPANPGFDVLDRNGNTYPTPPGGYDRTAIGVSAGQIVSPLQGDLICIYRGDASGNPAAGSGQYLWSTRRPAGMATTDASQDIQQKICKLILTKHADGSPASDAVQFIGRYTPGTDIPSSMPYELEFKLICGDQTSINGTQTNEAGDGSSISALIGKCALLRNHN